MSDPRQQGGDARPPDPATPGTPTETYQELAQRVNTIHGRLNTYYTTLRDTVDQAVRQLNEVTVQMKTELDNLAGTTRHTTQSQTTPVQSGGSSPAHDTSQHRPGEPSTTPTPTSPSQPPPTQTVTRPLPTSEGGGGQRKE